MIHAGFDRSRFFSVVLLPHNGRMEEKRKAEAISLLFHITPESVLNGRNYLTFGLTKTDVQTYFKQLIYRKYGIRSFPGNVPFPLFVLRSKEYRYHQLVSNTHKKNQGKPKLRVL